MRGLSRLRAPASALSSSTCSLRTPLSSPAAAFSSASSQYTTQHISATRARVWQNTLQTSPRRCLSTATPRCDKQTTDLSTPEASTDLLEDEFFDDELVEGSEFDTDLVYPRAAVEVPTAQEITDPDYVPAESGDGLEEVGGLVDWWERPGHWGESKKYVGFGPVEKVGDPAVLEVLARRAVIEALAIKQYSKKSAKDKTAAALQAVIGQEELSSIEEVELAPGENNTVAVKDQDDLKIVWSSLSKAAPASAPSSPSISIHEARRLSRTWGNEWKAAVIQDPIVKFYVAKRLQRLTGHVLTDTKLHSSTTIGGIIAAMIRKPKPKKLAELVEQAGIMQELPNVQFYPRRVTPIDKEQMVGRWKLIQKELQARELPVTGTGKYTKTVEWKWARGES